MIELKKEFDTKKYKMHHQMVYKDDQLVIYRIDQPFADGNDSSNWYEVFRYKVNPPDIYHTDYWERYPGDEAFGNWAWSCSNENCVAKVLFNNFEGHPLVEKMQKYIIGTYMENRTEKPLFMITSKEFDLLLHATTN